jgi:hypothetical protein
MRRTTSRLTIAKLVSCACLAAFLAGSLPGRAGADATPAGAASPAPAGAAGSPANYATFASIPFGSSSADVQKAMADKGYDYIGPGKVGDDKFGGKIGDYDADIYAYYDDQAKLGKWSVNLETPDPVVLAEFESIVKDFTARFGLPQRIERGEDDPFTVGDGKVAEAVRAKKGHFYAYWDQKGDRDNGIDVVITEVASVTINYEGPNWSAYVDRYNAKRKSDL